MTPISAPTDQAIEFCLSASDPLYFITRYVQIQHPAYGTIPFTLWPWQEDLIDLFRTKKRLILLKARQIGASELAASYALWLTRFHPSKKVLIISKNEDAATELMTRATFAHDHLPPWLQAGPEAFDRCTVSKANLSSIEFALKDKATGTLHPSSIQSLPATRSAGRSKSASLVILDEWAFQQWDKEIWTGIKPTVEHGSLIGISTANGLGNMFQKTWAGAVAGQNGFTPIFLSWRRHPERDDAWYAREAKDNEPWQLHQEYPSEPTEAFIQSGRPVFDHSYLSTHGARIAAAPGPLSVADSLTVWEEAITEQRDAQGAVTQAAHQYIVSADVAEGTVDGDYDAAVVLDRQTWHQVAELHGHWPLDVYAVMLADLATRFNHALLAVERNNHGHAVLLKLRELGYVNLFSAHADELTTHTAASHERVGWETTAKTKPLAIGDLAKGLRSGEYQPRSQAFLDEALIFAYQDNGSMSAPSGMHDDRVMAHAIGVHLLSQPDTAAAALSFVEQMKATAQHRRMTTPPIAGLPTSPR